VKRVSTEPYKYMTSLTERTITEYLWQWLDIVHEHQIDGEIYLNKDKRIDLVSRTPSGEYWGFEVKDQARFDVYGNETKLYRKLAKYSDSEYLDRLYYCSESPEDTVDKIRRSTDFDPSSSRNTTELTEIGGIQINIGEPRVNIDSRCMVVRESYPLLRTHQPKLSNSSESWVCHYLWESQGNGALREGVFPNRDSNRNQYVDVIVLYGSTDPTEIYNKSINYDYGIKGYEVKSAGRLGKHTLSQLQQQYMSGGLTELSLAVPEQEKSNAVELLDSKNQSTLSDFSSGLYAPSHNMAKWLSKIGLVTVDSTGTTKVVRAPGRIKMTIDGFSTLDTRGRVLEVGWGKHREIHEFDSIYGGKIGC
jgi:hypothetical protein